MSNPAPSRDFRIQNYLQRIGYVGPIDGSVRMLAELQERHLHRVPYENLDILRGVPLSLEIDHLFDKIVTRHRGGYCFELNALFGWLLRELGYPVTHLFARFWRDEPSPPPKRRHHVLRVVAEGEPYLCDVGVGGLIPRRPLHMVEGLEQPQGEECYRLDRDTDFGWMLHEQHHGQWRRLYSFSDEPQLDRDFLMASFWCEHARDSIFRRQPMIAIRTPDGRRTVAGREFRTFTPQGVETFTPPSDAAFHQALRDHFGIHLPNP